MLFSLSIILLLLAIATSSLSQVQQANCTNPSRCAILNFSDENCSDGGQAEIDYSLADPGDGACHTLPIFFTTIDIVYNTVQFEQIYIYNHINCGGTARQLLHKRDNSKCVTPGIEIKSFRLLATPGKMVKRERRSPGNFAVAEPFEPDGLPEKEASCGTSNPCIVVNLGAYPCSVKPFRTVASFVVLGGDYRCHNTPLFDSVSIGTYRPDHLSITLLKIFATPDCSGGYTSFPLPLRSQACLVPKFFIRGFQFESLSPFSKPEGVSDHGVEEEASKSDIAVAKPFDLNNRDSLHGREALCTGPDFLSCVVVNFNDLSCDNFTARASFVTEGDDHRCVNVPKYTTASYGEYRLDPRKPKVLSLFSAPGCSGSSAILTSPSIGFKCISPGFGIQSFKFARVPWVKRQPELGGPASKREGGEDGSNGDVAVVASSELDGPPGREAYCNGDALCCVFNFNNKSCDTFRPDASFVVMEKDYNCFHTPPYSTVSYGQYRLLSTNPMVLVVYQDPYCRGESALRYNDILDPLQGGMCTTPGFVIQSFQFLPSYLVFGRSEDTEAVSKLELGAKSKYDVTVAEPFEPIKRQAKRGYLTTCMLHFGNTTCGSNFQVQQTMNVQGSTQGCYNLAATYNFMKIGRCGRILNELTNIKIHDASDCGGNYIALDGSPGPQEGICMGPGNPILSFNFYILVGGLKRDSGSLELEDLGAGSFDEEGG